MDTLEPKQSLGLIENLADKTCTLYYKTTLEVFSSEYVTNLWMAITTAIFVLAAILIAANATFRKVHSMFEKREKMGRIYLRACDLAKTSRVAENSKACVHLTHKYHLDLNRVVTQCGLTIFQCACISGDPHLIKHFLQHGANVFKRTKAKDSIFYLAVFGHLQSKNTDFAALQMLLNSGCKVTDANSQRFTPLHMAAYHGDVKLIKFFIQQGADLFKQTNSGIYPIDCAISAGRSNVYDLLRTSK